MRTTRAYDLAYRLAAATGTRARVRYRPGGYRVELTLPAELDAKTHRAVLALLSGADRYGHHNTSAAQVIWAELDEEPPEWTPPGL